MKKEKIIMTYGTFDLLHFGHILFLQQAKALGDKLIVGLSTDEFNEVKGKISYFNYEKRKEMILALDFVDNVIPETCWEQKEIDIKNNNVDIIVMGSDWAGNYKFENLRQFCDIQYIYRPYLISTTVLKNYVNVQAAQK